MTKLQNGEETYLAAWKRICDASRKEFDAIYRRLGVELIERGESFYNPLLTPLVEELKSLGIVIESEGANVRLSKASRTFMMLFRAVHLSGGTEDTVDRSEI